MRYVFFSLATVLFAACSQARAPSDAGTAKHKTSANGGAGAFATMHNPHDAGVDVGGACQGRCATAADGSVAIDGGHTGSDSGHPGSGGSAPDAASPMDACVPGGATLAGNLLILFDRSQSMNENWSGTPKWQAAGNALINAVKPVENLLTIGAVLFPSPTGPDAGSCIDPTGVTCSILGGNPTQFCSVNPITAPDQVSFKPGSQAIAELQTGASGSPKYQPVGATPTSEAVANADKALSMATLTGNTAVVLITDGAPNCSWDQTMTVTTITNWLTQKKIKTYVVGLPGTGGASGTGGTTGTSGAGGMTGTSGSAGVAASSNPSAILEALAEAGGTEHYLAPADPAALAAMLADVAQRPIRAGATTCK